ncbi:tripartite motif-containing protein 2-like [Amphiura filiformis]|uniref:tripartite motif-containing protein 2-like n=1 Tax=Amphiura filiformis TaxID=82378 RepID=UPI003B226D1A
MAEASSLASTIDRHFLECVICSDTFNDPRALPCMHPFCCECLERWAKSCSDDNSIVSCPLCKNIYRIPEEEGIKGFPVHFLVTNLQDTVDKVKQKKSTTDICDKHGKKLKYFCENCGCPACSDCSALDPSHRGHSFIRLKEASRRLSCSLENLTRIVGNVEEKYTTAIQQTQQVKQNLHQDTDAKIQAIDEARNEFMQKVDNLVRAYQQDAYRMKEKNLSAIEQIEEKLQVDLASLRSSNELASNVIESGSDSDIISSTNHCHHHYNNLLKRNPLQ